MNARTNEDVSVPARALSFALALVTAACLSSCCPGLGCPASWSIEVTYEQLPADVSHIDARLSWREDGRKHECSFAAPDDLEEQVEWADCLSNAGAYAEVQFISFAEGSIDEGVVRPRYLGVSTGIVSGVRVVLSSDGDTLVESDVPMPYTDSEGRRVKKNTYNAKSCDQECWEALGNLTVGG